MSKAPFEIQLHEVSVRFSTFKGLRDSLAELAASLMMEVANAAKEHGDIEPELAAILDEAGVMLGVNYE